MRSIQGGSEESTQALRLQFYLDELKRQSEIASSSLTRGWIRAVQPDVAEDDAAVWGDLQSALFAAIVIRRILDPAGVSFKPKETHNIRQAAAKRRGAKLRELLQITESSALLKVANVRDSFEHFDERLDGVFLNKRASLVDWRISEDGIRVKTPRDTDVPAGEALRQFFPASGTLHFGDTDLDLFALDRALLELSEKVTRASEELAPSKVGPYTYGLFDKEYFDLPDRANARVRDWFNFRAKHGNPINPSELPG
jgi:hypothetical protein